MACSTLARASRATFGVRAAAPKPVVRVLAIKVQASAKDTKVDLVRPATVAAVANLLMATPAFAEAGKIFDFNLTLPVMAGQFLLLMVFLDKFWFSPVGKVLDERDATIRSKLGEVKDSSGDIDKYAIEAQEILKAARQEVTTMINSKKSAKQAELDKIYNDAKSKVNREVESSIAALQAESDAVLKKLDAQVEKISSEVLKRVLPAGVNL